MLQNPRKTLGFKKNMVYKIPPGGEVNHIQPVAYVHLIAALDVKECPVSNFFKPTLHQLVDNFLMASHYGGLFELCSLDPCESHKEKPMLKCNEM